MGRSIEKPIKIVCGEMAPDEKGNTKWPPYTKNNKKRIGEPKEIMPEGEMTVRIEDYMGILDNEGNKVARVDYKSLNIMVSKEMIAKEAEKATKNYMKEKGILSIEEMIEQNKIINFKDKKAQMQSKEDVQEVG